MIIGNTSAGRQATKFTVYILKKIEYKISIESLGLLYRVSPRVKKHRLAREGCGQRYDGVGSL